jgi:HPt (histidine-containing phosphotransfer) domain-containing protein
MFNLDLLKTQCGHDKAFFNEMLDIFIQSTLDGADKIEEGLAKSNFGQMAHYAHKIISPCRQIEAIHLIPLLKEIEDMGEGMKANLQRSQEIVGQIKVETAALVFALKNEYL